MIICFDNFLHGYYTYIIKDDECYRIVKLYKQQAEKQRQNAIKRITSFNIIFFLAFN